MANDLSSRISSRRIGTMLMSGTEFGIFSLVDDLIAAISNENRGALLLPTLKYGEVTLELLRRFEGTYGKVYDRLIPIYQAPLHCASCLSEFPNFHTSSLTGAYVCPHCRSDKSIYVYEFFPVEACSDEENFAAVERYTRSQAQLWWYGAERNSGQCDIFGCDQKLSAGEGYLYPYALRTRKSAGLMTRKLSVTESQKTAQFFGTSTRRKCRTDRQKSL